MTLRYPAARWDPLGAQTEPMMWSHDIFCVHTMVGSLAGTSSMFHANGYGGTESHLGVGESKAQGIEQWQDGMHEADANLEGHHRVFSMETADYGGVFGKWDTSSDANVPPWTADQLDMIVDAIVWFCRKATHAGCPSTWACHQVGVPCVLVPDSKPGRRGIAYHKQGCDPWRVTGGEKWSTAYGKGCPGNRRIQQLTSTVIPRAAAKLAGTAPVPEDDMTPAEMTELKSYIQLMTVAGNNYTRQVVSASTKAVLDAVDEIDDETTAQVVVKLEADMKALGDRIISELETPVVPDAPKV